MCSFGSPRRRRLARSEIANLRTITANTLAKLQAGDQRGATVSVKDFETTWDKHQPTLQPRDATAWHFLDGKIDTTLTILPAQHPNVTAEENAFRGLLQSLGA